MPRNRLIIRMTFDNTGIYKIFETCCSQIYQSLSQTSFPATQMPNKVIPQAAHAEFTCPKCGTIHNIQLNLTKNVKLQEGAIVYPKNNIFVCPNCGAQTNIAGLRMQFESQTGMKVII